VALNKQSAKKKQITLDKSCHVLPYTKTTITPGIFFVGCVEGGWGEVNCWQANAATFAANP